MKTVHKIPLDLVYPFYNCPLAFHQGDINSRELQITLMDEGQAVTITNSISAVADATVNGVITAQDESLTVDTTNNVLKLTLTENMLSLDGVLKIDIKITENTELLTAATLSFRIQPSVINDESRFAPVLPTIEETIAQVGVNTAAIAAIESDKEDKTNKVARITSSNIGSGTNYPSIAAVAQYLGANYYDKSDIDNSTYTKSEVDTALAAKAEKSTVDSITENPDFFQLDTQTLGGVTVTNNGDGSYTFNGTSTGIVLFPAFTIPAGDYTAHIGAVSGSSNAQGAIRYGTGSGELWISTNHTEESQTFASPTPVFFRLNTGTFTNWRLQIKIEKDGYVSAVDSVARDGLEEVRSKVDTLDIISEKYNYFSLDAGTTDSISVVKRGADVYEFSGTNSASTAFPEFFIPAGTYSAKIEAVSGTATARTGLRYGEGNGTSWVTDGSAQPVSLTFNSRTRVFFRLNIGEYSAWNLKITITNANAEYTAIDYKLRDKAELDGAEFAALSQTVAALDLPVNYLSAYNAFTCVDKTSVKLTAATNILAFGDSITHGGSWGTPWTSYLSSLTGCTVNNYAVSGALFGESVRTQDKWISTQITAATSADWTAATLVVVAAGTNDAGYSTTDSELAAKVQVSITAIRAHTNAPILFITPIKRGADDSDSNFIKLPKISGIIENVALKNQCSVICGLDFPIPPHDNDVIENMMGETGGYIHPNNTGGYVYAMCVINAVM